MYETVEMWLNGQSLGVRLCPPYRFDMTGALRPGTNQLRVEVPNTLAKAEWDVFSSFAPQEPSGLLGPVTLQVILERLRETAEGSHRCTALLANPSLRVDPHEPGVLGLRLCAAETFAPPHGLAQDTADLRRMFN